MNPIEFQELLRLAKKLDGEVELKPKEAEAYLPDISEGDKIKDFYLPKVPENFYYDPKVFRKLLGIR